MSHHSLQHADCFCLRSVIISACSLQAFCVVQTATYTFKCCIWVDAQWYTVPTARKFHKYSFILVDTHLRACSSCARVLKPVLPRESRAVARSSVLAWCTSTCMPATASAFGVAYSKQLLTCLYNVVRNVLLNRHDAEETNVCSVCTAQKLKCFSSDKV